MFAVNILVKERLDSRITDSTEIILSETAKSLMKKKYFLHIPFILKTMFILAEIFHSLDEQE